MPNLMKTHLIRGHSFDDRTFYWCMVFLLLGHALLQQLQMQRTGTRGTRRTGTRESNQAPVISLNSLCFCHWQRKSTGINGLLLCQDVCLLCWGVWELHLALSPLLAVSSGRKSYREGATRDAIVQCREGRKPVAFHCECNWHGTLKMVFPETRTYRMTIH